MRWLAGWGGERVGWQVLVAGWLAGLAQLGLQGRVVGSVGRRAGWDGGPGGRRGMDLWNKEGFGVNMVT